MRVHYLIHLGLRSFDGIRRRPVLHLLSIFTLCAAFLSFAASLTAAVNLDNLLAKWAGSGEMTAYLSDEAAQGDLTRLAAAVSRIPAVARVEPVTPETARARFARDLGKFGELARTLPSAAFPPSIEVFLNDPDSHNAESRRALAARLEKVETIKEVELYDDWFDRLSALTLVGRIASWGLGLLALVVAILVVAAVVRAGVDARSREIQVLSLVGATDRYVRLPFLIEGSVETFVAMAGALAVLHVLSNFAERLAGDLIPLIGGSSLLRLTPTVMAALLAGSALVGLLGAGISLRGRGLSRG